MRYVKSPETKWFTNLQCHKCKLYFTATLEDLKGDYFKKPGTFWLDGSAQAAGPNFKLYADCPNNCDAILLDTDKVPVYIIEYIKTIS